MIKLQKWGFRMFVMQGKFIFIWEWKVLQCKLNNEGNNFYNNYNNLQGFCRDDTFVCLFTVEQCNKCSSGACLGCD